MANEDTGLPENEAPAQLDDEELVKHVGQCRKAFLRHYAEWRKEADECFAFVSGDQWSTEEKAEMEELRRVPVVFNRIEPTVQSIAGHEVNNRQAVKYMPRQATQDAPVNELLTHAADWVRQQCDAEDEESDAFTDMLACGIGATDTLVEYDEEPEGKISVTRLDPLSDVGWDPAARKRGLTDAAWVQRYVHTLLDDLKADYPDKADELDAADTEELGTDLEEGEPGHNDPKRSYKGDDKQSGREHGTRARRTVVWHQWFEREPFWRVADPMTGQLVELDDERYAMLVKAAQSGLAPMPAGAARLTRRKYWLAKVCGSVLLEKREGLAQEGFTIAFITGRRDRKEKTWYGVVRAMVSPQRFANSYLSQLHALIRSNAKGGLLIEEGATDNLRALEEKWAQQDSVIQVNDGALSRGKLQPKPVSPLPSGPEKLLDFSVSSIRDVTGVNLEALGMADRNQPGIVELTRKESALTILAPLFNSLRLYRKVQGRVLAELIRRYISDGRLIRIVQGDGTEQAVPLLRLPDTMQYDVIVDSSSSAPDQKAKTFAVMAQTVPALEKSGFPTPPEVLDYLPLPQGLVSSWKKAVAQKMAQPPAPPPELQKAMLDAQVKQKLAEMDYNFKAQDALRKDELERYKATLQAQTKAYSEQLYATINEQSQILNAQAAKQESFSKTMEARINGMAKLVETIGKLRAQHEKTLEGVTRPPAVIALPDQGGAEMQAAAVQQMAQAVASLQQSLAAPKPPLRVIRDSAGNLAGLQ